MPVRLAKPLCVAVSAWRRALVMRAKADHLKIPEDEAVRLAGLLTLVGEPEENHDVFWCYRSLLYHHRRTQFWARALSEIPADPKIIRRVAECVRAYDKAVPKRPMLRQTIGDLAGVVRVMVQIKAPRGYVLQCVKDGLDYPGKIFHPNSLDYAQKFLKGSEGVLADPEVLRGIKKRVKVQYD
jgi:hypothetical protein